MTLLFPKDSCLFLSERNEPLIRWKICSMIIYCSLIDFHDFNILLIAAQHFDLIHKSGGFWSNDTLLNIAQEPHSTLCVSQQLQLIQMVHLMVVCTFSPMLSYCVISVCFQLLQKMSAAAAWHFALIPFQWVFQRMYSFILKVPL